MPVMALVTVTDHLDAMPGVMSCMGAMQLPVQAVSYIIAHQFTLTTRLVHHLAMLYLAVFNM